MQELIPADMTPVSVAKEGELQPLETQAQTSTMTIAEEILQPQYQRRWIDLRGVPTEERQIQAIRELGHTIPLNDWGLPHGIYRPDFLPVHKDRTLEISPEERAKHLIRYDHVTGEFQCAWDGTLPTYHIELWIRGEIAKQRDLGRSGDLGVVVGDAPSFAFTRGDLRTAWVQLDYSEGYPTTARGTPFWAQLDFEPPEAHLAFESYLTLVTVEHRGVRELRYVPEVMQALAKQSGIPMSSIPGEAKLKDWFTLYYWQYRTLAYDMFRAVEFKKKQEERAYAMLDDHYFKSSKMLDRLQVYMDDEEEFWSFMTPKVAIDLLKTLVGIQRTSVGLPAGTPAAPAPIGKDGIARGTPVTMNGAMKQLAAQERAAGVPSVTSAFSEEGGEASAHMQVVAEAAKSEARMLMAKMLTDPANTAKAQELIIALMTAQAQSQKPPG